MQMIVNEIIEFSKSNTMGLDMGDYYWDMVIEGYSNEEIKQITDKKYGKGAAEYIKKALRYYLDKVKQGEIYASNEIV